MVDLQELRDAAGAKARAAEEATRRDLELHKLVQAAIADGVATVKQISEATGLTIGRIYQIRDGRR